MGVPWASGTLAAVVLFLVHVLPWVQAESITRSTGPCIGRSYCMSCGDKERILLKGERYGYVPVDSVNCNSSSISLRCYPGSADACMGRDFQCGQRYPTEKLFRLYSVCSGKQRCQYAEPDEPRCSIRSIGTLAPVLCLGYECVRAEDQEGNERTLNFCQYNVGKARTMYILFDGSRPEEEPSEKAASTCRCSISSGSGIFQVSFEDIRLRRSGDVEHCSSARLVGPTEQVGCNQRLSPDADFKSKINMTYEEESQFVLAHLYERGLSDKPAMTWITVTDLHGKMVEAKCSVRINEECGKFPDHPGVKVTYTPGTTYLSTARFFCLSGYRMVGANTQHCQEDGTWSGSTTCLLECQTPSSPHNGRVVFSNTLSGEIRAIFRCFQDYLLIGSNVLTCLSTGNWSATPPICLPEACGLLSTPVHGRVDYIPAEFTPSVHYRCDEGYIMNGTSSRMCLTTGEWSGTNPTCNPIDCGRLQPPVMGKVRVSATTFMSTAHYKCDEDYVLDGPSSRTCLSTGVWNGTSPTCAEKGDTAGGQGRQSGDTSSVPIVAIVVPIVLVILVLVLLLVGYVCWRKRRRNDTASKGEKSPAETKPDGNTQLSAPARPGTGAPLYLELRGSQNPVYATVDEKPDDDGYYATPGDLDNDYQRLEKKTTVSDSQYSMIHPSSGPVVMAANSGATKRGQGLPGKGAIGTEVPTYPQSQSQPVVGDGHYFVLEKTAANKGSLKGDQGCAKKTEERPDTMENHDYVLLEKADDSGSLSPDGPNTDAGDITCLAAKTMNAKLPPTTPLGQGSTGLADDNYFILEKTGDTPDIIGTSATGSITHDVTEQKEVHVHVTGTAEPSDHINPDTRTQQTNMDIVGKPPADPGTADGQAYVSLPGDGEGATATGADGRASHVYYQLADQTPTDELSAASPAGSGNDDEHIYRSLYPQDT